MGVQILGPIETHLISCFRLRQLPVDTRVGLSLFQCDALQITIISAYHTLLLPTQASPSLAQHPIKASSSAGPNQMPTES